MKYRMTRFVVPAVAAGAALAVATAGAASAQPASSPGWRIIKAIPTGNSDLLALATIKGHPAWAGGRAAAGGPVVYHLVSGKWHPTLLPGGSSVFVNSMSATSPANVWASLSNAPIVERLTSKGWVGHTFSIGTDQILLAGVVSLGPKDTFEFAYDFTTGISYVYRYNGTSWHRRQIPDGATANSDIGLVSGTSYSNVWAMTYVGSSYASLRFNGTKWQVENFPSHLAPSGTSVYGREIFAQSKTSVWATMFTSKGTTAGPVVLLHWNGSKWSKVGGKLPRAVLQGPIAADGSGGLWLSASNTADTKPLLLHYSHGLWSVHGVPTYAGKPLTINALSLIPGTHSILGTALIGTSDGPGFGTAVIKYGP